MKRKYSITLAVFLLIVVLLNTVVGFACAIGLDSYPDHISRVVASTDHHVASDANENCCIYRF